MNVEEIKNLKNDELGRRLDFILDWNSRPEFHFVSYEDVCTKLDEVAKIEKAVIAETSLTDYGRCLVGVTECAGVGLEQTAYIAVASARTRAEVCLLTLETTK